MIVITGLHVFSQEIMIRNRFSSKERFTMKFQAFLLFILCALIVQLWFVFSEHFSLQHLLTWSEVVALKTALVSPRADAKKAKKSLTHQPSNLIIKNTWQLLNRNSESEEGRVKLELHSKDHNNKQHVVPKQKNNGKHRKRKRPRGQLLHMKWYNLCCESINCLRKHPLFPRFPTNSSFLNKFYVGNGKRMSAHRVIGYLAPPSTGWYTIQAECQSTCELWLSNNDHSGNSELFAKVVHGTIVNVTKSNRVHFSHDRTYYIEVIFTVYREVARALIVSWKHPNSDKFVLINERDVTPLSHKLDTMTASSPAVLLTPFLEAIEEIGEDEEEYKILGNKNQVSGGSLLFNGYTINVDRSIEIDNSITMLSGIPVKICVPNTHNKPRNLTKHAGVWRTAFSSVFPRDNTGYMACIANRYPGDCKGNARISLDKIRKLLRLYNDALSVKTDLKNLQITEIINIEKRKDSLKGSTYFMEILLSNTTSKAKLHDVRYLSMNKQGTTLCSPHETVIDRNALVNVVIVVKKQPRWLKHFLTNMKNIYGQTHDEKINIIIAYYGEENNVVLREFRSDRLPSIQTVRLFGKFNKTEAIQSAVDTITDENSIVFLMDLHIIIPVSMLSLVRKHTIQRKMVFNPVVFRLAPCAGPGTQVKPAVGFWETFGYGIMGIYKSDWDRIGGYGMIENTTQSGWGGEDWVLLDRILAAGLHVQRLKIPRFYHFHTRYVELAF